MSISADGDMTALHFSSLLGGHHAITIDLIKAGADLNATNSYGATPLHVAAQERHSEVMAALIEAGADVDRRLGDGRTPLLVAAGNGCLEAAKELLHVKANPLLAVEIVGGVSVAVGCGGA